MSETSSMIHGELILTILLQVMRMSVLLLLLQGDQQLRLLLIRLNATSLDDFAKKTTLSKSISTSSTWGALLGIRLIF